MVEIAAETSVIEGDWPSAAAVLQEFIARTAGSHSRPDAAGRNLRRRGLDSTLDAAESQLANAYLAAGVGAEARVIAEDLIARCPSEPSHVDQLRLALVMLGESDPDRIIAERLSSAAPDETSADLQMTAVQQRRRSVGERGQALETAIETIEVWLIPGRRRRSFRRRRRTRRDEPLKSIQRPAAIHDDAIDIESQRSCPVETSKVSSGSGQDAAAAPNTNAASPCVTKDASRRAWRRSRTRSVSHGCDLMRRRRSRGCTASVVT